MLSTPFVAVNSTKLNIRLEKYILGFHKFLFQEVHPEYVEMLERYDNLLNRNGPGYGVRMMKRTIDEDNDYGIRIMKRGVPLIPDSKPLNEREEPYWWQIWKRKTEPYGLRVMKKEDTPYKIRMMKREDKTKYGMRMMKREGEENYSNYIRLMLRDTKPYMSEMFKRSDGNYNMRMMKRYLEPYEERLYKRADGGKSYGARMMKREGPGYGMRMMRNEDYGVRMMRLGGQEGERE